MDQQATSLDNALARIKKYTAEGQAISIALCGNAAEIVPELVKRGVRRIWSPTRPAPTTRCMAICRKAGAGKSISRKPNPDLQGTILAAKR